MKRNDRKRPTDIQVARLVAAGRSDTQIGRLFDVSRDVIARIKRIAGIAPVAAQPAQTRELDLPPPTGDLRESADHKRRQADRAEAMWLAAGVDFSKDNLKFKPSRQMKLHRPEPSWPQRSSSIA